MTNIYQKLARVTASAALGLAAIGCHPAQAVVMYSIDLQNPSSELPPNPFISFKDAPNDSNQDGWLETVLKINLDPANSFDVAKFMVEYDGTPQGWTVNIGDSITNNGWDGDGATQYNDAEMQILSTGLTVYGNDRANQLNIEPLKQVNNFVTEDSTVTLKVSNEYFRWDNNSRISDSLNSPYLYALNGQPDTQGPVNYDIYAGFNRVIGSSFRNGSGVSKVTVCLESSSDPGCFEEQNVPEPGSMLGLSIFALAGWFTKKKLTSSC